MITTAYRPINAGHDYYGRGTYLITLVVSGRQQLLSRLTATDINALKGSSALKQGCALKGDGAQKGSGALTRLQPLS